MDDKRKIFIADEEIEESRFPTTRQGDANEARIQKLEENIDELTDEVSCI